MNPRGGLARDGLALGMLLAASAGCAVAWVDVDPPRVVHELGPPGARRRLEDWAGVVHVHSVRSGDAWGRLESIARDARRARCRFLVLTDHNKVGYLPREGDVAGLLVAVGTEVSAPEGHMLALEVSRGYNRHRPASATMDEVHAEGGYVVLAHPEGPRGYWKDWSVDGFDGMEVYNVHSDVLDESPAWSLVKLALIYPLDPRGMLASMVDRPARALARWDALTRQRPVAAFCGSDSHGYLDLGGGFAASHETVFRLVRTHALVEEPTLEGLHEALRRGRSFIGFDAWGDTTGFRFIATDGEDAWVMGEELAWRPGLRLRVDLPRRGILRVYRDGRSLVRVRGRHLEVPLESGGVYRVEADRAWGLFRRSPWIISNPIYVRDAPGAPGH
ncbi:MAG: hypothetical protein HY722_16255 [Planctomycetes bacterium]|nr:hypothetical protein [Planctomycetota bacterium]